MQPSDPLETERPSLEQLGKTRLKSVRVQRCGVRPTVKTAAQSFYDSSDDLCKYSQRKDLLIVKGSKIVYER